MKRPIVDYEGTELSVGVGGCMVELASRWESIDHEGIRWDHDRAAVLTAPQARALATQLFDAADQVESASQERKAAA